MLGAVEEARRRRGVGAGRVRGAAGPVRARRDGAASVKQHARAPWRGHRAPHSPRRLCVAGNPLQEIEDSVEAVESGLEHPFRHIVQSRVALLNVLGPVCFLPAFSSARKAKKKSYMHEVLNEIYLQNFFQRWV